MDGVPRWFYWWWMVFNCQRVEDSSDNKRFVVPFECYDSFANLNYELEKNDREALLIISAQNYHSKSSENAVCTEQVRAIKKTIVVDGYYKRNSLKVVWLKSAETSLKAGDSAVSAIGSAELREAHMLCPPDASGVSCLAKGSLVKIAFALNGCVDHLGTVARKTVVSSDGKIDLYVHALNVANKKSLAAFCTAIPQIIETLAIPENVNAKSEIRLHMVTKK